MPTTVDSVVVELEARVAGFEADLRRAQRTANTALGRTDNAIIRTERQMRQSSNAIQGTLRNLAGVFATAFTGRELLNLIDGFTQFQNALRVAGLEGENLANVQARLSAIGAENGASINALSNLYSNAAQSGRDLGVSQEQILEITERTAQALRVTGVSSAQASGAILGLTQAFAAGTVRAEEFNQINEGGLRPLLQAAAASEQFGGSVGQLRNAIVEGEISSRQFFDLIIAGSAQLEGQATQATLTLSGAFQTLRDQLTLYVGEASQTSGATATLSAAIEGLANNLDTIIPALAVIATAMGGRYVAGALAASTATRALTAHMAIATTSMAGAGLAARSAGAAMLGAFGGPVGLAITGVALGLTVLAGNAAEAEARIADLEESTESLTAQADRLRSELEGAGVAVDDLGDRANDTTGDINQMSASMREATQRAAELARQIGDTALAEAQASVISAQARVADAQVGAQQRSLLLSNPEFGGVPGQFSVADDRELQAANANLEASRELVRLAALRRAENADRFNNGRRDFIGDGAPANAAPTAPIAAATGGRGRASGAGRAAAGPSGPSRAELDARATQEQARLDDEILRAKIALANNIDDRADLELELLDNEAAARRAEIEGNTDLTADQRAAQLAIIDELFGVAEEYNAQQGIVVRENQGLLRQEVLRNRIAETQREQQSLQDEITRGQRQQLENELDRAVTLEDRRRLQLEIIDLEFQQKEAALQALLDLQDLSDIRRQEIEVALENLRLERRGQEQRANRDTESPFEEFQRELNESLLRVDEQVEAIAVGALDDLSSGLADALVAGESLGDVFEDAGKRALSALLELTFQLLVIRPLVESLQEAFSEGGGGVGGFISGLFGGGRQTGGPVTAGRLYQVNEGAGQGVELFQPSTSGSIIPLGQVPEFTQQAPAASSEPAVIRLTVAEGAAFEPRVEAISGRVSVETVRDSAPQIVSRSVDETLRVSRRRRT